MKKYFIVVLLCSVLFFIKYSNENYSRDTLDVMLRSNVLSLDIAQISDISSLEVIAHCIDGLMQLDADDRPIPAIAQSYDVSDDGKTYTFHLRDAKWSNGDPVTANDFVFSWRRQCRESSQYSFLFGSSVACIKNADTVINGANPSILGVHAPDPKTFIVELDAPIPFFLSLISFPIFFPINEKFFNSLERGTYATSPDTFLSNGAFYIEIYNPSSPSILLVKNNSYWNSRKIKLKILHFQQILSSNYPTQAFINGLFDVIDFKITPNNRKILDNKNLKNLITSNIGTLYFLTFNQNPQNLHAGILSNENLRLAISNAIDRETIANDFIVSKVIPTYTAIPIDFGKNIKTGEFFAQNQKRYTDFIGYNPTKAQFYLEKAKAELGRDSFELEMICVENFSSFAINEIIKRIKLQLEENLPNVSIILKMLPKNAYSEYIKNNEYDILFKMYSPDYDDPMTYLSLWTTNACKMIEHWSNPDYDKIIAECTTGSLANDYDARWNALYDAEKILLKNAVIVPLFTNFTNYLIRPNIKGIEFHRTGVNRIFKYVTIEGD